MLVDYIITAPKMHYGLTKSQVRELAFQFAQVNERKIPEAWKTNKRAGEDW